MRYISVAIPQLCMFKEPINILVFVPALPDMATKTCWCVHYPLPEDNVGALIRSQ